MKFTCPACGAKSISFLTIFLHFGGSSSNRANRFRCTSCDRQLKCFFSLPVIFLCGLPLQLGVLGLSGMRYLDGIFFGCFILTLITLPLYPIYREEESGGLFLGGMRFFLLCLGVLAIAWLTRFI